MIDPDNAGETSIYEGLVWKNVGGGIGIGTAWVIIFAFVGLILCLFKNCSKCPNLIVCIGFLLPLIAYGFIRQLPVESLDSDKKQRDKYPTDWYLIRSIGFTALIFVICCAQCLLTCLSSCAVTKHGMKVDSKVTQENQDKLKRQEKERQKAQEDA